MRKLYSKLGLPYAYGKKAILGFVGTYAFLSNFHMHEFVQNGVTFFCSEQAYMYAKSYDPKYRRRLLAAGNARECKRIGRTAKLLSEWDTRLRYQAMYKVLLAKFADPVLKAALLATGDLYLEETNTWGDMHWGRCRGRGENHLGRILMCVRYYYRNL